MLRHEVSKLLNMCMLGMAAGLFPACDDVLESIYDNDRVETDDRGSEYGFVQYDSTTHRGVLYLDCRDFREWTYVDFHKQTFDTVAITDDGYTRDSLFLPKGDWDLAFHRYDIRTNGGEGAVTAVSSLDDLSQAGLSALEWTPDEWVTRRIVVSMDRVFDILLPDAPSQDVYDYLDYIPGQLNPVLSDWIRLTYRVGPPDFDPTGRVYVARFADGTLCAFHVDSFAHPKTLLKGYLTISFICPL